nr:MAG TPA: hypothetical protein [Bacteriophage sp.]
MHYSGIQSTHLLALILLPYKIPLSNTKKALKFINAKLLR